MVVTDDADDDELADEDEEVADLVDDGDAHDVAQNEIERDGGGAAEVVAVDCRLSETHQHDIWTIGLHKAVWWWYTSIQSILVHVAQSIKIDFTSISYRFTYHNIGILV